MNLDTIAIVAQIIGSSAVVVSVIYLAFQVKGQTRQSRLEASRDLAIHWNEIVSRLTEDTDFPGIYLKGASDYDALTREEQFRFSIFVSILAKTAEQQYLHVKRGNLDPIFFQSSEYLNAEWLRLPGVQRWWQNNKNVLSREFSIHMEGLMKVAQEKGHISSFKVESQNPHTRENESDA